MRIIDQKSISYLVSNFNVIITIAKNICSGDRLFVLINFVFILFYLYIIKLNVESDAQLQER